MGAKKHLAFSEVITQEPWKNLSSKCPIYSSWPLIVPRHRLFVLWCWHPGQPTQMLSPWAFLWHRGWHWGNCLSFNRNIPLLTVGSQICFSCIVAGWTLAAFLWCSESFGSLFYSHLLSPRAPSGRALLLVVTVPVFAWKEQMLSISGTVVCELAHGTRCLLLLMCNTSMIAAEALKILEQGTSKI